MVLMVTKISKRKMKNRRGTDSSQDIKSILGEAVQLHQSGNLSEAESLYRKILVVDPAHADALHLLGVTAYQTGQNSRAIEYIQKAIGINPSMPQYYNNLGNAFLNSEETDEAVKCFEDALRINPDYIEACNNLGNALKNKGETERALDYYTKAIVLNPDYIPVINNLANLLKKLGRTDEAVIHYKKAISLDPGVSETYFNLADALKDLDMFDDAIEQYRQAISIRPDFAEAYSDLGNILKKIKKYDEAIENYRKAISLKPDFAEAYNNLSDTYRVLGKFSESVDLGLKAIQVKPDFESAYVNLGNIYLAQGNYNASIEQYQKAIEIRPNYPDAHYNMGLLLLLMGEFEEGWKEYGWRFKSKEIADQIGYRDLGIPVWNGTPLNGRTILIMSEQGFGDQIQFARYIPLIKEMGGRVLFECHKELMPLFESFEGIDRLLEKPYNSDSGENTDVCVQLLNLPGIFGAKLDNMLADVPYLKADPGSADKWESRFNRASIKIGIVWAGNPKHSNEGNRSCKLSDFTLLSSIPDVELFSLQKDGMNGNYESHLSAMKVIDLGKEIGDFNDTASIIEKLDLVISVDTSVAHLAGSLGRPVWTLLPFIPDWRWMLDREDTPWYPTMKLFRQREPGDWEDVLNRVTVKLLNYIKERDETK
jgi:tetratricopeptide (TPR) repeat protein